MSCLKKKKNERTDRWTDVMTSTLLELLSQLKVAQRSLTKIVHAKMVNSNGSYKFVNKQTGLSWAAPESSAGLVCQNRTGMKIWVKMKIMIGHRIEIGTRIESRLGTGIGIG